jgi:methylated-DNA-protein-cysteine methyltransferase-like protein
MPRSGTYTRIYAVIRRIPSGRAASYGQIARLAGIPGAARQVGYALHSLPDGTTVPWHRVVSATGTISRRAVLGSELSQRVLLEAEGVYFDLNGRVDLAEYGWMPREPRNKK